MCVAFMELRRTTGSDVRPSQRALTPASSSHFAMVCSSKRKKEKIRRKANWRIQSLTLAAVAVAVMEILLLTMPFLDTPRIPVDNLTDQMRQERNQSEGDGGMGWDGAGPRLSTPTKTN